MLKMRVVVCAVLLLCNKRSVKCYSIVGGWHQFCDGSEIATDWLLRIASQVFNSHREGRYW